MRIAKCRRCCKYGQGQVYSRQEYGPGTVNGIKYVFIECDNCRDVSHCFTPKEGGARKAIEHWNEKQKKADIEERKEREKSSLRNKTTKRR